MTAANRKADLGLQIYTQPHTPYSSWITVSVTEAVVAFHFHLGIKLLQLSVADLHLHLVSLEGPQVPFAQAYPEKHRL